MFVHAYVRNNSTSMTDPSGLQCDGFDSDCCDICIPIDIGIGIGGGGDSGRIGPQPPLHIPAGGISPNPSDGYGGGVWWSQCGFLYSMCGLNSGGTFGGINDSPFIFSLEEAGRTSPGVISIPGLKFIVDAWDLLWAPPSHQPQFVKDDVPLNPNARQIFEQVGRTAGQLNHPCTIGLFYGTSAVAGEVAVGGVEGATEAVAIAESHGIPATSGLAWLWGSAKTTLPTAIQRVTGWAQRGYAVAH